jgi:hypothetical protein
MLELDGEPDEVPDDELEYEGFLEKHFSLLH